MLLIWIAVIWFVFAPLLGIYLGLWLLTKRRPARTLILYMALTILAVIAFFIPFPAQSSFKTLEFALSLSTLSLWLVGAFTLRHEVIQYYSIREGLPFRLNPVLSAIFGPWYIGGHLRADFPLDNEGKPGDGVLKLIV